MTGWQQFALGVVIGLIIAVIMARIERHHPWLGVWSHVSLPVVLTVLAALNLAQQQGWGFAFLACMAAASSATAWSKYKKLTAKAAAS